MVCWLRAVLCLAHAMLCLVIAMATLCSALLCAPSGHAGSFSCLPLALLPPQPHPPTHTRTCRRFQQVFVDQPSVTDTVSILRGLRERYEVRPPRLAVV